MADLLIMLVHPAHHLSLLRIAQPEDAPCGAVALAHHLPWYVSSLARYSRGEGAQSRR